MSIVLSTFSLIAATQVITAVNPVHSIFLLVLVFLSTSILRISISMEFMALVFIMVYVGAIAVLFLFVVMMLNVKPESNKRPLGNVPMMLATTTLFMFFRWSSVLSNITNLFFFDSLINRHPVDFIDRVNNIQTIGQVLYTTYSIEFLVAGVVLLVSIIGAIMLTLTNNTNGLMPALRQQVHQQHSRDANYAIFKTH